MHTYTHINQLHTFLVVNNFHYKLSGSQKCFTVYLLPAGPKKQLYPFLWGSVYIINVTHTFEISKKQGRMWITFLTRVKYSRTSTIFSKSKLKTSKYTTF